MVQKLIDGIFYIETMMITALSILIFLISGGGIYLDIQGISCNISSIKIGNWVELSDSFQDLSQITYNGQYLNGLKIGRWDIFYRKNNNKPFQLLGGGLYDEDKGSIKIGKWTEVYDGFTSQKQIIYYGEYQNGNKIGRWDIFYESILIGGGSYDQKQKSKDPISYIKVGRWIELSRRFQYVSQVTYQGDYIDGQKIGTWYTYWNWNGKNQQIGGGYYNCYIQNEENIFSIKTGQWIELNDNFNFWSQILCSGEYQNGKKVGLWSQFDLKNRNNIMYLYILEIYLKFSKQFECS
ncbi:unnamed protein product [Paramecium sonneborni]|uniref:Uncharacterized protein n=1 Tax=Paramecium sonneborni TaxID=65129 RepID=A0A8S1RLY3_9CILI|nr:unnamed protein product [Paramecium sonneborni]